MNTHEKHFSFQQKILVIALLVAFGPVQADDAEVAKLIKPDTTEVSVGIGGILGSKEDKSIIGQYNGGTDSSVALPLDFEVIKRNDETGTWLNAEGRDLGMDGRELSISRQKQGDWKYSLAYSEQVRHDPRTVNTGLQGVGSTQLTVNTLATPGSGVTQNFDIKRRSYTLGFEKWINPGFMLEASLKSENKDGTRMSGLGAYCSDVIAGERCATTVGALLMMPEPVNSTTHQFEAKANFIGANYMLTAGYYGSIFRNDNGSMRFNPISGNLVDLTNAPFSPGAGANTLGNLLTQPVGLAPDNQAYQLYLSGNYAFTPTIRATFRHAVTHASQNQSFASMGMTAGAGLPDNLGGVVDTTLTQFGLTARPMPKLSLVGNFRYEDIQDKTPQANYGGTYLNAINSSEKINGKAEASYQLPENVRATLGVDYARVKRNVPAVGSTDLTIPATSLTSIREKTQEVTYRAELRKSMSETVNAAVSYSRSKRDGSHWINLGATSAAYPSTYQEVRYADIYTLTGVFPSTMMDRQRDKVRIMVDWMPSDKLSLQFNVENGQDDFTAPTTKGLHSSGMSSVGVDAAYALSDKWKATAYFNQGKQSLQVDHSAGYIADIDNTTTNIGIGLAGQLTGRVIVGGDVTFLNDRNSYGLGSGNTQAPGVLPDVTYRSLALRLFGKYALDGNADVRVDLVHQNLSFNEWTWSNAGVPFAYSDNSTVTMQPNQNITYLGVKYVYRFK